MGLFDKKFCDICNGKIGLLGNRKLEDGNMCKDCAKKLSPFFTDRRGSTIAEIKNQLAYREQNKQALASFAPAMTYGDGQKIYVDTMRGNFVVSHRTPGNWSEENPDVIPISSVMSCNLRIDEDRDEIYMEGNDGERRSYNPPRYNFYYEFILEIRVNNPYFDEIEVRLNSSQVEGLGTLEYNRYQQMAMQVTNVLTQNANVSFGGGYNSQPVGGYAPANGYNQPMNQGFNQPVNQGYNQPAQQVSPVSQSWFCTNCGAKNESGKFCESCGTPKV